METKGNCGSEIRPRKPDSRNSERPMESARNREADILTADYRMSADRGPCKCGRCARPPQKPKRGGGQPKLMHPERAMEWKNVRLCSLMFAYVRLTGKKMLRPLRAAV